MHYTRLMLIGLLFFATYASHERGRLALGRRTSKVQVEVKRLHRQLEEAQKELRNTVFGSLQWAETQSYIVDIQEKIEQLSTLHH